ncbi:MAG: hypothetical protein K6G22_01300 [Lachnospiraceae bacterium]|nr:hypothetical protein [Lachnospiraceae bacterium]
MQREDDRKKMKRVLSVAISFVLIGGAVTAGIPANVGAQIITTNPQNTTIDVAAGDTLNTNRGTVTNNNGDIVDNYASGTVVNNNENVSHNSGTVQQNNDYVGENYEAVNSNNNNGNVYINYGDVTDNNSGGTVYVNSVYLRDNGERLSGTVTNNSGEVTNNWAEVTNNLTGGVVKYNTADTNADGVLFAGIVSNNSGEVTYNWSTVTNNLSGGVVVDNDSDTDDAGILYTGTVVDNSGEVTNNSALVTNNLSGGTVVCNYSYTDDDGEVHTGTVMNNAGTVTHNYSAVTNNSGRVINNYDNATVGGNAPEHQFWSVSFANFADGSASYDTANSDLYFDDDDYYLEQASGKSGIIRLAASAGNRIVTGNGTAVAPTTCAYSLEQNGNGYILTISSITGITELTLSQLNLIVEAIEQNGTTDPSGNTGVNGNVVVRVDDSVSVVSDRTDEPEPAPAPIQPEPAETISVQAAQQLASVQSNLAVFEALSPEFKEVYTQTGMPLNMTDVETVDANTVNMLIAYNSTMPYVVTVTIDGLATTVTIPKGFNFLPFIKADGTINILQLIMAILFGQTM